MSTNLEIEFKNLLTKEEYQQLLTFFSIDTAKIKTQKNIYFDTSTNELKERHAALRIRLKGDSYEFTLKTKDPRGALELNQDITELEYLNLTEKGIFINGQVSDELTKLGIHITDLKVIADLTTNRIEFPYKEGTLFLDESFYRKMHDYEVEYEAPDYEIGLATFKEFLEIHKIPVRHAEPKIRRAQSVVE